MPRAHVPSPTSPRSGDRRSRPSRVPGPGTIAPLQDIAKRLGISQAALLHRVGTKEALMSRALRPVP
ncbi:TetR family transcriptional regulator, partial [Corallococcus exercitus]|nr:TetR family transcriptional regulator [Corallococcus exercitus]